MRRNGWFIPIAVAAVLSGTALPSTAESRTGERYDWRPAEGYSDYDQQSGYTPARPADGSLFGVLFGRRDQQDLRYAPRQDPRYLQRQDPRYAPRQDARYAPQARQGAYYNGPAAPAGYGSSAYYEPSPVRGSVDPRFARQFVAYSGAQSAGTIVISTADKFLYLIEGNGRALRYGIGVGRPGFVWSGLKTITRKAEWPGWTPPAEMLMRRPELPAHMAGGPSNPLGARAMYLGSSLYRIHGTNEPETIGTNVSSGCIRMMNEDVVDLYDRVAVGTKVIVL